MIKDMTTGSPLRHLAAFSWPLLLGNIIQNAYTLADTAIVGRLLGDAALAAVGSVTSMIFVVLGFVFGLTAGTGVITAQRFGARDPRGVRLSVGTGVWVCAAFTVGVTALCLLFTDMILRWLNTPATVFPLARAYLRVSFLGTACIVFFNFQSAMLRALGDSRTPLWFLAGASLLNIILDILFIRGFGMGVAGAAWATNAAIFASALGCFLFVTRRLRELQLRRSDWRPRGWMAREQLKVSLPMGLQFSITGFGAMVLQSAINTFGVVQMAGMTAARNVEMVAVQLPVALGQAMATYSAQNYGAGKLERIRSGVRASVAVVAIGATLLSMFTLLFGKGLIALFVADDAANTPGILTVGIRMLHVTAPFFMPLGCIFIFRNTLQGIGHSLWPMLAGVAEMALRAGVAIVLLPVWNVSAVYWGDPCAWVGACLLLVPAYLLHARRWPRERPPEVCPCP